jgi:hypothetical protein
LAGQGAGNHARSRLSRRLFGPSTSARVPKEPAKSRLQPRLAAPLFLQTDSYRQNYAALPLRSRLGN